MAGKYLNKAFLSLKVSKELKDTIQAALLDCFDNVKIKRKEIMASKFQLKSNKNNEDKSVINNEHISPSASVSRKQFLEQFNEKVEENKLFALKLIKEQRERLKKKSERGEKIIKKQVEEQKEQEKIKEELIIQRELQKQKKIKELQEKSDKRKKEINYYKDLNDPDKKNSQSAAPLFKKIEEDFFYRIEMPELERRKRELQNKRELHKPISHIEIVEHMKHIESLKSELKERREKEKNNRIFEEKIHNVSFNMKSKFTESILEEERRSKEAELRKEQEKKLRVEKKKKYAEIVNEMFQPSVDKFKQQEMKLIKARLQIPVKLKSSMYDLKDDRVSDYSRSVSVQPKK